MRHFALAFATAGLALAITALALSTAAPSAHAAETRAEYVAQVEPICLAAEQEAKRRLKKSLPRIVKALKELDPLLEFEKGRIPSKKQARKLLVRFVRLLAKVDGPINKVFEQATGQLGLVPPAPGDEAAVSTWLAGRTEYARLSFIAVRAGLRGNLKRYLVFSLKALDALRLGQEPVNAFGLDHCFIEVPVDGPAPFAATAPPAILR